MANELTVRPRLTVLTGTQAARVHDGSLKVLSTVGMRVDSARARRVFSRALGQASGKGAADDHQIRIPPELIEWAIQTAPPSVDIYDRRGSRAFRLGQDRARFGIGVTTLTYQDPETDRVVPFTREHMQTAVRLGNALASFDVVSTVGVPRDVPAKESDLYATLDMTANTLKPLVLLVSDEERFPDVLDLLEHLHGELATRPFVVPYLNPISPLVLNAGTVEKMWTAVERGLPLIFSNYGMAGASTPITPGEALVLLNAELLAGLALAQLIKPGTPVILGSLPAFLDMRTTASFYDTTSYLLNLACAEMMAHYRLPHCGTSGSGIGWGPDLVASGHQWINHLLVCTGKVGLAPFVGDTLGSKAFSPALLVYADEVIAQARRFAEGFTLEETESGMQEIATVGPGGSFLATENTLTKFRSATYQSGFFDNLSLEAWQAQDCPRAIDRLRQYTRDLLDELDAPDDYDELLGRGQAFIQARTAGRL
jgi:trimethylamine--corrinoid protein Co-methyltransferase